MDRLNDLISKEEVLKQSFTFVDESGIGLSYYNVVGVSNIEKMPTVNAIIIPEDATKGDMIKAMFPDIEMWGESKDTLDYSLGGMIHRVTKSWWNAPYKEIETEKTKEEYKKMKTERAMEILNNVVNFVSVGNDTGDTINELLKYGFEAEELVNDFHFSKADVEDVIGEKIEEEEERE